MTSNKGNQVRNRMISRNALTDVFKIAKFETFIHETHPDWVFYPQPYLKFTKGEDEFAGWKMALTKEEVGGFKTHHPDALIFTPQMLIFELDGIAHNIKTKKTQDRNDIYELNGLRCIAINEEDLKYTLGVKKSNKLSQQQINDEFERKLK